MSVLVLRGGVEVRDLIPSAGGSRPTKRGQSVKEATMRAYYLVIAVAASLAALAMASQLNVDRADDDREAEVESEMEAWFI